MARNPKGLKNLIPSKPGERRGGRKKGTPNKINRDIREMVLLALNKAGGVTYLTEQAKKNPNAFMGLVGKTLPMTLKGDPDNPIKVVGGIEIRIVDPKG